MKKIISLVLTIAASLSFMGMGSRNVPGPNRPPVAKAGPDMVVARFANVFLDASESFDPDGDKLYYEWKVIAAPQNTMPRVFAGQRGMKTCHFRSDILGTYVIALTVYDGQLASQRDVMQIRVQDPSADPNAPFTEQDIYIPEPIKIGKSSFRPAPDNSNFIIGPDKYYLRVKFKNPSSWQRSEKMSFIYDWTPIKKDGKNTLLRESTITLGVGPEPGVREYTFGLFDSPKKGDFKTLAIQREHAKGYDILYSVQLKADR